MDDEAVRLMNARSDAVFYISSGAKSSGKVSGWLGRKGYPDPVIESVVGELIRENRINDLDLAMKMIRGRSGKRLESPRALTARLIVSGIPQAVAEEAVSSHYRQERSEEEESLQLLTLKFSGKADTMHAWDPQSFAGARAKMYRFLVSRGYEPEVALRAIGQFLHDQGSDG